MIVNDFLYFDRKSFVQVNFYMLSNRLHVEVFFVDHRLLYKVEPNQEKNRSSWRNEMKTKLPLDVIDQIDSPVSF